MHIAICLDCRVEFKKYGNSRCNKCTYQKYKSVFKSAVRRIREERPWYKTYYNIRNRCKQKSCKSYNRYGGSGIKMLISLKELETLWIRDKAGSMNHPQIDRIDSSGNYEISNCRYIERIENIRRSKRKILEAA